MTEAEMQQRRALAACYRLVDLYEMSDGIGTHISARIPGRSEAFLINRYGWFFDEMTASSLVAVDANGRELGSGSGQPVNPAGFNLHSCVHEARPDIVCVLHTHSVAGMAVSACAEGLLPLSQHGMQFFDRIGYHDYEGLVTHPEEQRRIASDLGDAKALVLRNHGLLTAGTSVAEAFYLMWRLEKACRAQIHALSTGREPVLPGAEVARRTSEIYAASSEMLSELAWEAFLRKLERDNPGYAD